MVQKSNPSLRDLQCLAMRAKILTSAVCSCLDDPDAGDLLQQLVDKIYSLTRLLDEALDREATDQDARSVK